MFKLANIKNVYQERTIIRIVIAVVITALLSMPGLMNNGKVLADSTRSDISCGNDSICKSIKGNQFDLILYSSLGSEMVILYSADNIGDLNPKVRESYYSRAKGTVKDAIYYLSKHMEYRGFRFKKARKSTGFFKSEVIDGLYVAVPKYESVSDNRPPEYSFSEKNGRLTVSIRPIIRESNN